MALPYRSLFCALLLLGGVARGQAAAPRVESAPASASPEKFNPRLLRRFKPLRAVLGEGPPPTPEQVHLGQMLYFDRRLSKDQTLSCNSCHVLSQYGIDTRPISIGVNGVPGTRNSPSVFHAAGHIAQFWDGRIVSIDEQAGGPLLNPKEMAMGSPDGLVALVKTIPGYVAAFHAAYPQEREPLTFASLERAFAAFERMLVTPARWDRFLEGDQAALSPREIAGLKVFTDVGCMVCHTGEFVGGSMFQKTGVLEAWPNQRDEGRFAITHDPADKMVFKVPSLRNVAETAPYFHDASAKTLEQAVRLMGKHQLGLALEDDEVSAIASWLKSLTGELPKALLTVPALPPDGADTQALLSASKRK